MKREDFQIIMTKNRAAKILGYDLPKLNQIKIRYDMGKYALSGRHGRHDKDCIIWFENRQDKWGKHIVLYTVEGFILPQYVR